MLKDKPALYFPVKVAHPPWIYLKFNESKTMVDTPQSGDNHDQSESDLEKIRTNPNTANSTPPSGEQEEPEQQRHYAQHAMRVLKAIGRATIIVVNWIDEKGPFVTAIATVVITVLTGFYVHYSRAQWRTMQAQYREMKLAREQAKTDNASAITAQQEIAQQALSESQKTSDKSLNATIEQFHLDQRAWIGAVEVKSDRVTLFNSGRTVAKHVIAHFHMRFSPIEFKELPHPVHIPERSVGVLIPSAQYPTKFANEIPAQEIDKQNISSWYTYIWGEVGYVDIFKQSHQTVFCSYRKGAEGDFSQCPFHNDAT